MSDYKVLELDSYDNVKISNLVVDGTIGCELDLHELKTIEREDWTINHNPGVPITVEFTYQDLPMLSVYSSGSYIIRGSFKDKLKEINKEFIILCNELGIIEGLQDVDFEVANIVGTISLDKTLDLDKIAQLGDSSEFQYEPSQFPAVTYRGADFYTCNIFNSGKIVIQGCSDEEELKRASKDIQDLVNNYQKDDFTKLF